MDLLTKTSNAALTSGRNQRSDRLDGQKTTRGQACAMQVAVGKSVKALGLYIVEAASRSTLLMAFDDTKITEIPRLRAT
jgi:hypothetical protein